MSFYGLILIIVVVALVAWQARMCGKIFGRK